MSIVKYLHSVNLVVLDILNIVINENSQFYSARDHLLKRMADRSLPIQQGKGGGDGLDFGKSQGSTPPSNRSSLDGTNGVAKNGSAVQSIPPTTASGAQPHPIVKIGHYVLGETLGVGTFGKVKSKLKSHFYPKKEALDDVE